MNPVVTVEQSRVVVRQLRRSPLYRDYEKAFRETTGLPLALRPLEAFDLPYHGDPKENGFCRVMATTNHSCAACLQLQRRVEDEARAEPKTLQCFAGLFDSAIPIRVGTSVVAFLQTGQVMLRTPGAEDFARTVEGLSRLGLAAAVKELEPLYFATRVLSEAQYASIIRLLAIFAQHLSTLSNQLIVQSASAEPAAIARARAVIAERHADALTLSEVARAANMSTFYFCKRFKKATGLTFTEYLARVRVEKVTQALLDRRKRVSEAAYDAGFQSLSQFNRVFRRVAGESPTIYRDRAQHRTSATT